MDKALAIPDAVARATSCFSPFSVSLVALGMGTSALLIALALWGRVLGFSFVFISLLK